MRRSQSYYFSGALCAWYEKINNYIFFLFIYEPQFIADYVANILCLNQTFLQSQKTKAFSPSHAIYGLIGVIIINNKEGDMKL